LPIASLALESFDLMVLTYSTIAYTPSTWICKLIEIINYVSIYRLDIGADIDVWGEECIVFRRLNNSSIDTYTEKSSKDKYNLIGLSFSKSFKSIIGPIVCITDGTDHDRHHKYTLKPKFPRFSDRFIKKSGAFERFPQNNTLDFDINNIDMVREIVNYLIALKYMKFDSTYKSKWYSWINILYKNLSLSYYNGYKDFIYTTHKISINSESYSIICNQCTKDNCITCNLNNKSICLDCLPIEWEKFKFKLAQFLNIYDLNSCD